MGGHGSMLGGSQKRPCLFTHPVFVLLLIAPSAPDCIFDLGRGKGRIVVVVDRIRHILQVVGAVAVRGMPQQRPEQHIIPVAFPNGAQGRGQACFLRVNGRQTAGINAGQILQVRPGARKKLVRAASIRPSGVERMAGPQRTRRRPSNPPPGPLGEDWRIARHGSHTKGGRRRWAWQSSKACRHSARSWRRQPQARHSPPPLLLTDR